MAVLETVDQAEEAIFAPRDKSNDIELFRRHG
jgi:hypothetical protein